MVQIFSLRVTKKTSFEWAGRLCLYRVARYEVFPVPARWRIHIYHIVLTWWKQTASCTGIYPITSQWLCIYLAHHKKDDIAVLQWPLYLLALHQFLTLDVRVLIGMAYRGLSMENFLYEWSNCYHWLVRTFADGSAHPFISASSLLLAWKISTADKIWLRRIVARMENLTNNLLEQQMIVAVQCHEMSQGVPVLSTGWYLF